MSAERVLIVAEAGVNHNGSPEMAKELIRVAARCGADYVKFQTFRAEQSLGAAVPKAEYQKATTGAAGSFLDMVKALELPFETFAELAQVCRDEKIGFLSTPFDTDSVELLAGLDMPMFKIPSGELTNAMLLLDIARRGKPILMSTGMATLKEVEQALTVLAHGLTTPSAVPGSSDDFRAAYAGEAGRRALREKVTLLQCTTEYPAPFDQTNLRAMATMRDAFDLPVGFSDHTQGITAAIAAAALGATVIEKHFTMDRDLPGPDQKASLEPDELASLVKAVREVEDCLGESEKRPMPCEIDTARIVRKSLATTRSVEKGAIFTTENLGVIRPGTGISAIRYFDYIGRPAEREYAAGELI